MPVSQHHVARVAAGSEAPKDWEFKTVPYIWLVFMTGDAAIGGTSVPVDTNVFKIFDSTDFAFGLQGHFEAWYRRKWGLLFDGTWVVFKQKNLMGGTPLQLDIKGNYGLMEFAGLYNFLDIPFGTEPDGPILSLQGLAGARVSIVSMDLDFDFAGSMDESVTWADPILGGRSIYRFGNERRWAFTFRWDVGGFGAGSDFTWNLAGLLGYDFHIGSVPATAIIGAKALYQDFEDGSGPDDFKWDVTQYGPLLGLGFRF